MRPAKHTRCRPYPYARPTPRCNGGRDANLDPPCDSNQHTNPAGGIYPNPFEHTYPLPYPRPYPYRDSGYAHGPETVDDLADHPHPQRAE